MVGKDINEKWLQIVDRIEIYMFIVKGNEWIKKLLPLRYKTNYAQSPVSWLSFSYV